MIGQVENPQLRVLPPDFAGPVCVECKFTDLRLRYCHATEAKVIRPAQKNPVTGEVSDAWLIWTECRKQNANGDCELFERKSEETLLVETTPTAPSFWRWLAGEIAAVLLGWSKPKTR